MLTSGVCSEDGLEDATTLLLQLSKIDKDTRDSVLVLLLDGARDIAFTLCAEIKKLLTEIREYNLAHGHEKQDKDAAKVCYSSLVLLISGPLSKPLWLSKLPDVQ